VDTSSYPKPTAQPSLLDSVQKFGNIQAQKLNIDQAKLDQANQALGYMVRAMGSLGPNASKEDYAKAAQNAVDQGLVPQQQENVFLQHLQNAPDSPTFYRQFMSSAMESQKQIEMHTGINSQQNDNANQYQGKTNVVTGGFQPTTQLPTQMPPGTPTVNDAQQKGYTGPVGPPGVIQSQQPARLPVAAPNAPVIAPIPANVAPRQALPVASPSAAPSAAPLPAGPVNPAINGQSSNFGGKVVGATVEPNKPAFIPSEPKPMFEEGKKLYTNDQLMATQKATSLKPLEEAYDLAKNVATGAGTETLNKARAYLTNAGLMSADEKNPTVIYQMLNKNLAQFIDKNGSRSDADLAVKESGNANAKTQLQPALLHMVQKIIGRERIEIARSQSFKGNDYENYSAHSASFPTSQDERAYSLDKMPPNEARNLYSDMKAKALKGNAEGVKFINSLNNAVQLHLVNGLQ
jgi:hypothetical protein